MTIKKEDTFKVEETVDRYRAIYYAGASGDFNPIHIDPDIGKFVGLGGVILHGMCTLGFAAGAITDWAGDPGKLKKLSCRFSAPVMLEDTVTVEGVAIDVADNRAAIELKVSKQTGQEVLTRVTAEVEI